MYSISRMRNKTLFYLVGFVAFAIIGFNVFTIIFLRTSLKKKSIFDTKPSPEERVENPYARNTDLHWVKTAIHLHTNKIWFTFLRNTPEEIQQVYSKYGYKILAFTDYEKVTIGKSSKTAQLPGYEWGKNLVKRHLSVLGPEKADYDFFPIYAFPENLQWAIDRLHNQGNFVVINHPLLNKSFPLPVLEELSGYDAIEVFSPFGDITFYWDRLLSMGIPSFCMAADDLHYLPQAEDMKIRNGEGTLRHFINDIYREGGQSLMRYILVNTDSLKKEDILKSLQEGNYLCVRKMDRTLTDPKIVKIGKRENGEVFYEFGEMPMTVDFIGRNGEILAHTSYETKGSYMMRPSDTYVRIQALFPTGIVLSNPFYGKN